MLQVLRVDEAVALRFGLEAGEVAAVPLVAGLGLEDLLELFDGLGCVAVGSVLELPVAVVADPTPVCEEDPEILVLVLPNLGEERNKWGLGLYSFLLTGARCSRSYDSI